MYLSQSLCLLYNHNLNMCCTAKKIMILQLFILISGQIFKMFQYKKKLLKKLKTKTQYAPKGIEVTEVSCWLDLM